MAKHEYPVREYDDKGQLVVAGYQWLEERPLLSMLKTVLIEFSFAVAILVAGMWMLVELSRVVERSPAGGYPDLILSVLLLVSLGGLLYLILRTGIWRKRAVLFHRSGEVSAPYGLADSKYFSRTRPLYFNFPGRIVSIETRVGRTAYPVNIYFSDGRRLLVDVTADFDDARMIAVQLTNALQELRTDAQRPPEPPRIVIN